ncbi:D-glycero-alpha-D-manno-heptose-1,7-bisphosphate 7-phosphatase [Streptomyces sp. NPDC058294]|uniref:D-glycero-alpha-D-manno-heptose-1,7-bisphosphate 7-phosphatase n=1 Tax=Streptomyces sp. NPDC058294 TaxID=3346430 RepID=UPI0036E85C5E
MNRLSAVLFDRDGTLVRDVPYNGDPGRVRLLPGAAAAVALARSAGLPTGVVSNQSGIGRGLLTVEQVLRVNARADELLGGLDTWLFCPHAPDAGCACRKPRPGLIRTAAARLGVEPAGCLVIGDIAADVLAARAAGARGVLVPNAATAPAEVARFAMDSAPDVLTAVRAALAEAGLPPGSRTSAHGSRTSATGRRPSARGPATGRAQTGTPWHDTATPGAPTTPAVPTTPEAAATSTPAASVASEAAGTPAGTPAPVVLVAREVVTAPVPVAPEAPAAVATPAPAPAAPANRSAPTVPAAPTATAVSAAPAIRSAPAATAAPTAPAAPGVPEAPESGRSAGVAASVAHAAAVPAPPAGRRSR